jgi:hypothetical protein
VPVGKLLSYGPHLADADGIRTSLIAAQSSNQLQMFAFHISKQSLLFVSLSRHTRQHGSQPQERWPIPINDVISHTINVPLCDTSRGTVGQSAFGMPDDGNPDIGRISDQLLFHLE